MPRHPASDKVSVLGAGAIGSWFGGMLALHAPELDLVLTAP